MANRNVPNGWVARSVEPTGGRKRNQIAKLGPPDRIDPRRRKHDQIAWPKLAAHVATSLLPGGVAGHGGRCVQSAEHGPDCNEGQQQRGDNCARSCNHQACQTNHRCTLPKPVPHILRAIRVFPAPSGGAGKNSLSMFGPSLMGYRGVRGSSPTGDAKSARHLRYLAGL